jgi:hypothetical protein
MQIANGAKRILQMIEQAKAQHQVGLAKFLNVGVFYILNVELNVRVPLFCLYDVIFTCVKRRYR